MKFPPNVTTSSSFWYPALIATISAFALSFTLAPPSSAQTSCIKGDARSSGYQLREGMERCEGIRGSRPISASGLRLASYTIGKPLIYSRPLGGKEIALMVPAGASGPDGPMVTVRARGSDYQMIPLQLGSSRQGWRPFAWGTGLLQREGIGIGQLRATALLRQPGDADLWVPVKFASAGAYTLVIASNGALPVANVRIFGPGSRLVQECSGPTQLETELLCRWDGRNVPAGTYRLVASSAQGGSALLNVSLRHDPSWLKR